MQYGTMVYGSMAVCALTTLRSFQDKNVWHETNLHKEC